MTAQEIRQAYIDFFKNRNHVHIPRASLIPTNDPSTLFTSSGMQPLITYLLGEKHQDGNRLVDSQTCLRMQDIEEIGDNRHTTFFEMLGNWSLGDYFKSDQLPWLFEFLVDKVGINPSKLYVTCYIGNPIFNIEKDTDSADIWQKLFESKNITAKRVDIGSEADGYKKGMSDGRIFFYDGTKNWWSRGGSEEKTPIGDPCGPDSEIFYDFGTEHNPDFGQNCHPNCDCGRFMEIGNSVFMTYLKTKTGFEPLENKNVDFGGGLERIAAASLNNPDVFEISLLKPIINQLEDISDKNYSSHTESMRIIADHLRAATFLAIDGLKPSNKEQGYVMRRLIRRAIRFAFELGIEQNFFEKIIPIIVGLYKDDFKEVLANQNEIILTLINEEKLFRRTLNKGLKELSKITENERSISGDGIFKLYDTFGFPVELVLEEIFRLDLKLNEKWKSQFDELMDKQRQLSKTAAKGTFKGGLGGQTLIHKKYHTATHLLYQALRNVLGDHVIQRGSNITEERLRFDFSHDQKMTPEEIKKVEDIVNEQIDSDLKVSFAEYPTKVAREEMGALGQFGDRYGDNVKVYKMIKDGAQKPFSFEICGGPHVDHTSQLKEDDKNFVIIKEESSSAGVRRIKAVLK